MIKEFFKTDTRLGIAGKQFDEQISQLFRCSIRNPVGTKQGSQTSRILTMERILTLELNLDFAHSTASKLEESERGTELCL